MFACCALIGALSACTQPDQYLQFSEPRDVEGFIVRATGGERVWTQAALLAQFGEPVGDETSGGARTVQYYGLELTLSGDTLQTIALVDSRFTGPQGIRVGLAAEQVIRRWGPPLERADARLTYEMDSALVDLTVTDQIITRVTWRLGAGGR